MSAPISNHSQTNFAGSSASRTPRPAKEDGSLNDYTFERAVEFSHLDRTKSTGRIDLYKKHCFIMEAKQSREKGSPKALNLPGQLDLIEPDYKPRGQRRANRAWDQLMISARRQAEEYARALPASHGWPPFVLVCDVGHCIEVYADFIGPRQKLRASFPTGRAFAFTCRTCATKRCASGCGLFGKIPLNSIRRKALRQGHARHRRAAGGGVESA